MAIGEERLRELALELTKHIAPAVTTDKKEAIDRFEQLSDGADAVLDLLAVSQHSELSPDDSTVAKAALLLRRLVREMTAAFEDVATVARR
jgi:hypothetical protein